MTRWNFWALSIGALFAAYRSAESCTDGAENHTKWCGK